MRNLLLTVTLAFLICNCGAQATIGLLQANSAEDGYELFAPIKADTTYLIDKCGRLVHQWASPNNPGMSVYLLPDGSLLRSANVVNAVFRGNGEQGGAIEKYDWDNNLTWSYTISSDTETQNHDIYPLDNGNILVVIWEAIDSSLAIAAGKNRALLLPILYSAKIEELQPVGTHQANIVWQWRLWDHLIQDFDSTKSNYGVVADHPELVNLNYTDTNIAAKDWIHPNAVTYNATLDQIILSSHNTSELWILDHSTTTAQAKTHTGGAHGKGGDLLYRWGNPRVYGRGTTNDQVFYTQHNPSWIPAGYPHANSIIVFNNGLKRPGGNASSVDIFTPPVDSNGDYTLLAGHAYGPASTLWSYKATPPSSFFGLVMGGAQLLPNGNVIVCEGPQGNFFEIDSNKNVLWRYVNPVSGDSAVAQGTTITNSGVFRCTQYDASYSAFSGKTLAPLGHIELNPILTACDSSAVNSVKEPSRSNGIVIYPNPTSDRITLELGPNYSTATYTISNLLGQVVRSGVVNASGSEILVQDLVTGLYLVNIEIGNQVVQKKIIVNR